MPKVSGLGTEAQHRRQPSAPEIGPSPLEHRTLFFRGVGQKAGHAQTQGPLCRNTSLGWHTHAQPLCPDTEGRASPEWLIGMPGKSPALGGGPACSPCGGGLIKDSWSSGQGIRLDIWRLGAGSSLLLLCWVTLSRLLGLSVPHLPPASSLSGKASWREY